MSESDHPTFGLVPGADPSSGNPDNGWTPENETLLRNWTAYLHKSSFIYGLILEKYRWRYRWVQIATSILSAISSLLGVILSTLGSDDLWVNRGMGIATAIIGAAITVMANLVKITSWDTTVDALTLIIHNFDLLYSRVTAMACLPASSRERASDAIAALRKDIDTVNQSAPSIGTTEYVQAETTFVAHQTQIMF